MSPHVILAGQYVHHVSDNNSSISSSIASAAAITLMCFTSRARNRGDAVNRSLSSVARLPDFHTPKLSSGADAGGRTDYPGPLDRSCLKIAKCPEFLTLKWHYQDCNVLHLNLEEKNRKSGDTRIKDSLIFHCACPTKEVGFAPGRRYYSRTVQSSVRPSSASSSLQAPAAETDSFAAFHGRISADLCAPVCVYVVK